METYTYLYRYEISQEGEDYKDCKLSLTKFPIIRETEKSYWIYYNRYHGRKYIKEKLVRKGMHGKFARETEKQALCDYINRTNNRIWFLEADLEIANNCLGEAREKLKTL